MSTKYKAVVYFPVRDEDILEAETLFPNLPQIEAIKALLEYVYLEGTGKTYEEDGSLVEISEVH